VLQTWTDRTEGCYWCKSLCVPVEVMETSATKLGTPDKFLLATRVAQANFPFYNLILLMDMFVNFTPVEFTYFLRTSSLFSISVKMPFY
jgi:hypothetical protein